MGEDGEVRGKTGRVEGSRSIVTAVGGLRRKVINDLKGRKSLSCLEAKNRQRVRMEEVVLTDECFRGA